MPPSPPALSREAAGLSRSQILLAADRVLAEAGYDGTTIRRIAGELDCAVGSIYRYFVDKRELLGAVVQRRFEPLAQRLEAGEPSAVAARAYVDLARAQPQYYHLMFWLAAVAQPRRPAIPAVVRRMILAWSEQLGGADAEQLWMRLHGAVTLGTEIDGDAWAPPRRQPPATPTASLAPSDDTNERDDVTLL